ncbi:peptide-methionine (S)-S-oxide reductase MsrA [Mucilaginibacter sp. UR6-1]|nr:peptide-methionine (S)-S-oxide reductase MsrA [Mucilaginibacter sp. UR6-1]MCC8408002.1 peptide-methionine (S)-S-oxide reductase MsrA [Mucilaginibacter sp. UR6-1]
MITAINTQAKPKPTTEKATFGMGCFWCTEAIFQQLKGVKKVESGYSGGTVPNPSYEDVCTGETGHAEVIQVTYDPAVISYKDLLEVFWKMHDATTLNRQGADVGTQYRSVIFYSNADQKALAEKYKKELNDQNAFGKPVVTQIAPLKNFYKAEDYHQNYYKLNGSKPYCRIVIKPKMDKLEKIFKAKLKQ